MEYKLDFKKYSDSLKSGKLLGLKCDDCGCITCPPKMTCQKCRGTDLDIVELNKTGTIKTFTTTYVAPLGREVEAPYTIVLVQLDDGPWIAGNLIDIDPTKADMSLIGRQVILGSKFFPGDLYSAGEAARPLFSFETHEY